MYENMMRQQTDGAVISRHKKIKDAARMQGSTKHQKNHSANRNTGNLQLLANSAHGNYASNKRYESSVKTTNVGSSAAQSQLQRKHKLPIGFIVQKEMKASGITNDSERGLGVVGIKGTVGGLSSNLSIHPALGIVKDGSASVANIPNS